MTLVLGVTWSLLWGVATLQGVHVNASLWYPPAGLTFALALVLRPREWPVLFGAVLVGTALSHDLGQLAAEPVVQALLIPLQALAHATPYLAAAMALRRLAAERHVTDAVSAIATLAVWPVAAAGAAGLGTLVVALHGGFSPREAVGLFVPWFAGDLVGVATTGALFTLLAAPLLRGVLGPGAIVGEPRSLDWRPHPTGVVLTLVAALGLVTLARAPGLAAFAGGVPLASYGPILAMLLVGCLAPPPQTHAALLSLVLVTMGLAAAPGAPRHVDPQIVALALAAAAQLGVALRALAEAGASDPLTGLANRRAWLAGARRRLSERRPHTLLLIDLDHFKTINDRFGHAVGDDVLRAAAAQIRTALGEDAWVGRIGGEEFAALVPGGAREGNRRAHRVRAAVRRTATPTAGETLVVATSVGLAPAASPAELETALHAADDALYRAKDAGRDRVAQGLVGG
mgnify:CR=1 FL=1